MKYGMFSSYGDDLVAEIVKMANTFKLDGSVVMGICTAVSKDPNFAEITDTEVRESIGDQLEWYK